MTDKDHKTKSYKRLYTQYKSAAKIRELSFKLTFEQFLTLINEDCIYCGTKPSTAHNRYLKSDGSLSNTAKKDNTSKEKIKNSTVYYNGIDRVNNKKGYTIHNSVACCFICNRAKQDMPYMEFVAWMVRLADYRSNL